MSKESFHHSTVPHYCPTDAPRPRRKGLRELPEFLQDKRAGLMQARKYVWKWVRDNWAPGERFYVALPREGDDPKKSRWARRNGGRTGTFVKLDFNGHATVVYYRLDGPPAPDDRYDSSDTALSPYQISAFDFYHYAVKEDES